MEASSHNKIRNDQIEEQSALYKLYLSVAKQVAQFYARWAKENIDDDTTSTPSTQRAE